MTEVAPGLFAYATQWLFDRRLMGIVFLDRHEVIIGHLGGLVDWARIGSRVVDCLPTLGGYEVALTALVQRRRESWHQSGIMLPPNGDGERRLAAIHGFATKDASGLTLIVQDMTMFAQAGVPRGDSVALRLGEVPDLGGGMPSARKNEEQASQVKALFLANVGHELRTPLNVIIGNAEILRDWDPGDGASDELRLFADDILNNGIFLLDYINGLLDLASAEDGGIDLVKEPVDVNRLVDSAVATVGKLPRAETLAIRCDPADALPRLVGDSRRLGQVVLNLLTDAISVAADGDEVLVRTLTGEDGALMIEIAVDMSQAGPASADGQASWGDNRMRSEGAFGIPFVRTLVEMQGGSLSTKSSTGETTRLTLRFPPELSQAQP